MRIMQPLTRDVGIFIVLTVKIVVQFAVATDVHLSELFATPCTSAEARKMERQGHANNATVDAGRRDLHCLDREDRRPIRHRD